MTWKRYNTKEEALEVIKNSEDSSLKCIKSILEDDVFEVPLKSFIRTFGDEDMGTIVVEFTYSHSNPMMWMGDWFIKNYFNVNVLESKFTYPNFEKTWEPLFSEVFKEKKIDGFYGFFLFPIEGELKFLTQLCNLDGDTTIHNVTWKKKN